MVFPSDLRIELRASYDLVPMFSWYGGSAGLFVLTPKYLEKMLQRVSRQTCSGYRLNRMAECNQR